MNNRTISILALIGVSCGYGSLNIAARWLGDAFGVYTQVYLRIFLAMIFTLVLFPKDFRWSKIKTLTLSDWLILLVMGTVGYGFMVYTITRGALTTSLLNVAVIFSTVPVFVYLLGITFLRKPWKVNTVLILLISIWGVGVLSSGRLIPNITSFGVGDLYVLAASFFEAIWFIGIRLIGNKLNSREITVIAQGIATIPLFAIAMSQGEALPTLNALSNLTVIAGLAIGVLMNIAAPLITIFAFKHLDEVLATQLFLTENIFALIVGYYLYNEVPTMVSLIGAILVIGSVYLNNRLQQAEDFNSSS